MTIFEKIIAREIPSTIVFENDAFIAFKDINPKAPVQVMHPDWSIKFDWNQDIAAKTRAAMLERAEFEHILLAVPHTPFPGLGLVTRDANGVAIWQNAV